MSMVSDYMSIGKGAHFFPIPTTLPPSFPEQKVAYTREQKKAQKFEAPEKQKDTYASIVIQGT